MPLATGTRLGPYEIVAPLGAGGMGEVYRANDTRLDRTVAIKVLPEALAADPQFRERFDREARAISHLTNPYICTLHDVGDHGGTAYLVMEFLEGETLEARLNRAAKSHGIPMQEALTIAIQVADALAAAHRAGVVHRDLKPGNVMLTKSGAKLLDFGLAKTAAPAVGAAAVSMLATTPSNKTLTDRGAILGTFQYMAPEQVEGGEADARTDIFAFGCVLYQMLTGRRAFEGKTQASLIAAILEREPAPVTTLQPLVSPLADAIVRKCLAKNPDDRWQSAVDLRSALRWVLDAPGGAATTPSAGATPARSRRVQQIAGALVIALVAFALGVLAWRSWSGAAPPASLVRFEVVPPVGTMLAPSPVASAAQLAISPDGRHLAFVLAPRHGASQLWLRALDGVQAQPLAGTEDASYPFWSPDSRFIAFFAGGKLKKIDTTGGAPQSLCNAPQGRGGAWSPAGVIVFTAAPNSPMSRINADGGVVQAASAFNAGFGVTAHNWPQFLPDGRHFLFYQRSAKPEHQGAYVGALDTMDAARVLALSGMALYGSGRILFTRESMLFAQPFDDRALRASGEAVHIADHIGNFASSLGYMAVTVSPGGVLAYGPSVALATNLEWRDRAGATGGAPMAPGIYRSPRLSPDEKRVAMTASEPEVGQSDIWILELARRNPLRLTFDPLIDWFPAWSRDGRTVFFGSSRTGLTSIFKKTGAGPDELVIGGNLSGNAMYPMDVSSDGRTLLFGQTTSNGYDLGAITLDPTPQAKPLLSTPFNEVQARFSPNGRWVAYASDESGKFEVYVRPFSAASGQSLVSSAGGMQPEWRRDAKELFYVSADRKMMAVPVTIDGDTFTAGTSRALFDVQLPEASAPFPTDYAVTADGQRFLVNAVVDQPTRSALTVVLNWTAELKK
jgi:Tol biopolymer transport system component